jgi:hypothetical protein
VAVFLLKGGYEMIHGLLVVPGLYASIAVHIVLAVVEAIKAM